MRTRTGGESWIRSRQLGLKDRRGITCIKERVWGVGAIKSRVENKTSLVCSCVVVGRSARGSKLRAQEKTSHRRMEIVRRKLGASDRWKLR